MELWDMELEDARRRIAAAGKRPEDFAFDRTFLPPDPDGAGMFTVQYEVRATYAPTDSCLRAIGGIGMGWVDYFEEALKDGYFD
jgi:hypothetical protein